MTNILQWNLNGYKGQYEMLQKVSTDNNIDIICIQETNLKKDETINLKNFTCFNKNREECKAASGGVGLLVKNQIYSEEIQLNTKIEAVAPRPLRGAAVRFCRSADT